MKPKHGVAGRCGMKCVVVFALLPLALTLFVQPMDAQTAGSNHSESQPASKEYRTFYLTNVTQQTDFTDIVTDLRNMLSRAKVYYLPSEKAISILGTSDDLSLAQRIISDTDRPRKNYRLTYTITDIDNGAPVGARHVSFVVESGASTEVKEGNRVPIATESARAGSKAAQMQYLDIGLNIRASVVGSPDNLRLNTQVEESSMAGAKTAGAQDPVIRQTTLNGTSDLEQGKSVVLGSLDLAGDNRREEIAVRSELVQ